MILEKIHVSGHAGEALSQNVLPHCTWIV